MQNKSSEASPFLRGSSFSHNSILNFLAQLSIFSAGLFCVPYIISKLSIESFGLLALLWMVIGYFGFLDFGIGQASIKFVSESVAKGNMGETSYIVRSMIRFSWWLGVGAFFVVVVVSIFGIERIINIPPHLQNDATRSLQLLALCIPAVTLQGPLRSVLLSFNRFDLSNFLQMLTGIGQWVGTAVVTFLGGSLLDVVIFTVAVRYLATSGYFLLAIKLLPGITAKSFVSKRPVVSEMVRYGGWVSISQFISPTISFLERALIGYLATLAWLTYFTVPVDAATKLLVVSMSFAGALVPFMSANWIDEAGMKEAKLLYHRAIKYTLLIMIPLSMIIFLFSCEFLDLWLGAEFANKSNMVLKLVGIGIFFHSMAQLPNAALLALGRPDITAKLLMIELPLYAVICFFFTMKFGINGTVSAWLLRVIAETIYLFAAAHDELKSVKVVSNVSYTWKATLMIFVGGLFLGVFKSSFTPLTKIVSIVAFGFLYLLGLCVLVLDESERKAWSTRLGVRLARIRGRLSEDRSSITR